MSENPPLIDLTQLPEEIDLTGSDDEDQGSQRSEEFKELQEAIEYQCSEIPGDDNMVLVIECRDCHKLKVPVCDLCVCGYADCCAENENCECEACQ